MENRLKRLEYEEQRANKLESTANERAQKMMESR